jgi:serine protease Do
METNKKKGLGILSIALALTLALALVLTAGAAGTVTTDEISGVINTQTDKAQITSPFIQVANQVRDSIVGVNNYQAVPQSRYGYRFSEQAPEGSDGVAATGSGVVISKYGHVLTNYHVVNGASRLTVTYGIKEADATLVASDPGLDIAILLVPGIDLPAVTLGDSDKIQVGEWSIVVGNPLGQEFDRTVTVGVISAFNRAIDNRTVDKYGRTSTVTNQMIQMDAAITSGNSGGGLFNILGQLQGIPSIKYDSSAMFGGPSIDNIGMSLPINAAKPLIKEALEKYDGNNVSQANIVNQQTGESGSVQPADPNKPRMGVTITTLASSYPLVLDGTLPQGAYITAVETGSPAETAGLKTGDIIVEVNSAIVKDSQQLVDKLSTLKAGDKVEVKYFRAQGLDDILQGNKNADTLGEGTYQTVSVELKVLSNTL